MKVKASKGTFFPLVYDDRKTTRRSAAMKLTDTPVRGDTKSSSLAPPREKAKKVGSVIAVRKARSGRVKTKVELVNLPSMTASQLKKDGWPGVMAQVNKVAAVLVTNHHRNEAVILTAGHYASLVQRASMPKKGAKSSDASPLANEIALARLQSSFDQRLAKLKDGKSLGAVTSKRARRGKVNIGSSY